MMGYVWSLIKTSVFVWGETLYIPHAWVFPKVKLNGAIILLHMGSKENQKT